MKSINRNLGKFLYGITFLILIPAGLWYWAKLTQDIVSFPVIESKVVGSVLIILGGSLMFWGIYALQIFGKGLPMNAYPPPVFVTKGPYRLFRHPIYWGFGMFMIGWFITTGSASGIWLVSPLTILGIVALVLGYEEIDLKQRFPGQKIKTVLDLPENNDGSPGLRDRFASLFWILSFLILSNFLILKFGGATPPLFGKPYRMYTGFTNPLLPFLNIIFIIAIPFFLKRKDLLREWEISGILSVLCAGFIAFLYPAFGAQYLPSVDLAYFTAPAFLLLLSLKSMFRQSSQAAILFTVAATILIIFQVINCYSTMLYFIDAVIIFILSANYLRIWIYLKNSAEKMANSWKEWVFGSIRVINHGFYVGFGAFLGVLLAGILAGKNYSFALMIFTVICLVFSALWAQIIEGSAKLKRPFGYYGALVGIPFGSVVVWAMGLNVWIVIGVSSVVMPWVQAVGRLRCLVNGCCHGRKTDNPDIGIRFSHYRSRVCNISGLKGELVHPTQLYSILWLSGVGILLLTLWNHDCSSPFIFGLYLILTSLGRFVEEAYRGEVQTPILSGLHLYQWTAIIAVIVGILMTIIRTEPADISPGFSWEAFLAAAICGLFTFFAMGVDFPNSNARFSRLV